MFGFVLVAKVQKRIIGSILVTGIRNQIKERSLCSKIPSKCNKNIFKKPISNFFTLKNKSDNCFDIGVFDIDIFNRKVFKNYGRNFAGLANRNGQFYF